MSTSALPPSPYDWLWNALERTVPQEHLEQLRQGFDEASRIYFKALRNEDSAHRIKNDEAQEQDRTDAISIDYDALNGECEPENMMVKEYNDERGVKQIPFKFTPWEVKRQLAKKCGMCRKDSQERYDWLCSQCRSEWQDFAKLCEREGQRNIIRAAIAEKIASASRYIETAQQARTFREGHFFAQVYRVEFDRAALAGLLRRRGRPRDPIYDKGYQLVKEQGLTTCEALKFLQETDPQAKNMTLEQLVKGIGYRDQRQ